MAEKRIYIFALAAHGEGLSGGDRIFIELARVWSQNHSVTIFVWEDGERMIERQHLMQNKLLSVHLVHLMQWLKFGFVIGYFAQIIASTYLACTISLENSSSTMIYNASEFWMDSFPTFILKLRFPRVTWIATWYQTAPNPIKGFAEGSRKDRYRVRAFAYWFFQLPIKPLINSRADVVVVNNEDERKRFVKFDKRNKVFVMIGAVKINEITSWIKRHPKMKKQYDAVFQGRFHPQKGVVELIDIWKKVVEQKPDARLAMIGDGPLMADVRSKISQLGLEQNITLLGYVFDGDLKYQTFAESKIVVHPAFYDSGGMASAEAMVFALPCVGFDLVSYQSYYPHGMVKVKIGDLDAFAKEILKLLDNEKMRHKIGKEAFDMICDSWSWEKRAKDLLNVCI